MGPHRKGRGVGGFNEVPEDSYEGEGGDFIDDTIDSSGCSNSGLPPCNCMHVYANGLQVSRLQVWIRSHQWWTGRWKVTRNGHLFVRSPVVTVFDNYSWDWFKDWTFAEGDVLCGGFYTSTGHWIGSGPACETIHS